jgi:hypothetical protein
MKSLSSIYPQMNSSQWHAESVTRRVKSMQNSVLLREFYLLISGSHLTYNKNL